MKINIITSFLTLLFISCSSNDDSINLNQGSTRIVPKQLQVLALNQAGELVTAFQTNFGYNSNKKINRIETSSINGNENIDLTYGSNGLPNKIDFITTQGTQTFNFGYNGTTLSSYSVDGVEFPVLHNTFNNSYSFQKGGETVTYFLNNSNDVTRLIGVNPNGSSNLFQLEFENEKYGFLHNVDFPLHLYLGIVSDPILFLLMSHNPLNKIISNSNYEYSNSFDEDDFLIESVMNVEQQQNIIQYEYQEL